MHAAVWYSRIESGMALLFSFFINLAVVSSEAVGQWGSEGVRE